ncbi:MAG: DUF378 domain-containing protein [candidate division SR1 bacterium]|nr:DUF378 domain-containing protein [candidate division SR1 bacterium]
MKVIYWICLILLVVGGLNRALIGWMDLNLVTTVFPDVITKAVSATGVETVVTTLNKFAMMTYTLVGISAVFVFISNATGCKCKA